MPDTATQRLLCYELAPQGALASAADQVALVIRKELGVAEPTRHIVEVTPSSGWVRYYDRARLWQKQPAQLPSRDQALAKAEAWMKRYAKLMLANPALPDSVQSLQLAPAQARPQDLAVLANMSGDGFDHWLYRAQPLLSLGDNQGSAQVLGSAIEIRIGDGGAVIGFSIRWRALTGKTVYAPKSDLAPRMLDQPADDPNDKTPPELVYVLDGEFSPQTFLSPYYLRGTGHEISVVSASQASLTIDFYGRNTSENAELTAFVMGGSGDYDVRWGVTTLGDPGPLKMIDEARSKTIGTTTASTIYVPVGAYLVVISARDRKSGATAFTQQYAICGPFMANGELAKPSDTPPTTPNVA